MHCKEGWGTDSQFIIKPIFGTEKVSVLVEILIIDLTLSKL